MQVCHLLLILILIFLTACQSAVISSPAPEEKTVPATEEMIEKTEAIPEAASEISTEEESELADSATENGWKSYPEICVVRDIAFDKDGNLWAARALGVVKLDLETNTIKEYTRDDGLPTNDIRGVAVGDDGSLWFGTQRGGVSKFDGEAWTTYTEDDGLVGNFVRSMALAPNSVLWFGTYEGDGGVSRFDGVNWTTFTEEDGLAGPYVMDISVTDDDMVWLGHDMKGISHFDGESWTTYTEEDGLVSDWILSLHATKTGELWIGTLQDGISHFDGDTWTTYTEEDGLVHNSVTAIIEAPDGAMWFATEFGVSRFDGET